LNLRGLVGEVDGSRILRSEISGHKNQAEALGIKLADEVLDAGGREILARLYAAEANKH